MTRKTVPIEGDLGNRIGYSRAVRVGNHVYVSGTTALDNEGVSGKSDAGEQARITIKKISSSLKSLGVGLENVVRTRVSFTCKEDWEAIAEAHNEFFSDIRPASAFYAGIEFVHPDILVEIEVDAVIEVSL